MQAVSEAFSQSSQLLKVVFRCTGPVRRGSKVQLDPPTTDRFCTHGRPADAFVSGTAASPWIGTHIPGFRDLVFVSIQSWGLQRYAGLLSATFASSRPHRRASPKKFVWRVERKINQRKTFTCVREGHPTHYCGNGSVPRRSAARVRRR
jgi:hypothetical protein